MTSYIVSQTADWLRQIVKFCMGCTGGGAGKIWRITGIKSFKGERGNFKLDASVDGQPVKFLQNGGTRISISLACNNTYECILQCAGDEKYV